MLTWDGRECPLEQLSLQSVPVFHLVIGPSNILVTTMFVSMTVTAPG